MISLPSTYSAPPATGVTFRVEPTVTSGVPVDEQVTVDIYIDAETGSAIIGWRVDIKVDPDVLEPGFLIFVDPHYKFVVATGGGAGYFLNDWCKPDTPNPVWPNGTKFQVGAEDALTGTINGTVESLVAWTDLPRGEGAAGSGKKLVTFYFTSKNQTALSPIEITTAYYYTSLNSPELDKRIPDVINGYYNEPPPGPPTLRVDLVGHSAWPGHRHHDVSKFTRFVTLFGKIKNVGDAATYGQVRFTIEDAEGIPIDGATATSESLAVGQIDTIDTVWRVPGKGKKKVNYGKYYVTAEAWYQDSVGDWQKSPDKPKTFSINVIP